MCRAFPTRAPRRTHRCLDQNFSLVIVAYHWLGKKLALVVLPVGVHVVEKIGLACGGDDG